VNHPALGKPRQVENGHVDQVGIVAQNQIRFHLAVCMTPYPLKKESRHFRHPPAVK
jgi:hypothetical protein